MVRKKSLMISIRSVFHNNTEDIRNKVIRVKVPKECGQCFREKSNTIGYLTSGIAQAILPKIPRW